MYVEAFILGAVAKPSVVEVIPINSCVCGSRSRTGVGTTHPWFTVCVFHANALATISTSFTLGSSFTAVRQEVRKTTYGRVNIIDDKCETFAFRDHLSYVDSRKPIGHRIRFFIPPKSAHRLYTYSLYVLALLRLKIVTCLFNLFLAF